MRRAVPLLALLSASGCQALVGLDDFAFTSEAPSSTASGSGGGTAGVGGLDGAAGGTGGGRGGGGGGGSGGSSVCGFADDEVRAPNPSWTYAVPFPTEDVDIADVALGSEFVVATVTRDPAGDGKPNDWGAPVAMKLQTDDTQVDSFDLATTATVLTGLASVGDSIFVAGRNDSTVSMGTYCATLTKPDIATTSSFVASLSDMAGFGCVWIQPLDDVMIHAIAVPAGGGPLYAAGRTFAEYC